MKRLTIKKIMESVNAGEKVKLPCNRLLPDMFLYKVSWRIDLTKQYIIESKMPMDSDHSEFYFIEKYNELGFKKAVSELLKIGIIFKYR